MAAAPSEYLNKVRSASLSLASLWGSYRCMQVHAKVTVHLPAEYLSPARLREGIQRKLNERLLRYNASCRLAHFHGTCASRFAFRRYVEDLSGVILSYENLALAQELGRLHNEVPYVHFDIVMDGTCWLPTRISMTLSQLRCLLRRRACAWWES